MDVQEFQVMSEGGGRSLATEIQFSAVSPNPSHNARIYRLLRWILEMSAC